MTDPTFVIKPWELPALNYLEPGHSRPQIVEWINRGTNQKLKRSSEEMLLRTLFRDVLSASAVKLHRSAGLRAKFATEKERDSFARAFAAACTLETYSKEYLVTAIFDSSARANQAVSDLHNAGIPEKSISLLWKASQFMDKDFPWNEGHSKVTVATALTGGGVAGAMLGVGMLAIPGVGPAAADGAIVASSITSVATVSGIIGAAGSSFAARLTDQDVDHVSDTFFQEQDRRGKVFVSVDTRIAEGQRQIAAEMLKKNGGRTTPQK